MDGDDARRLAEARDGWMARWWAVKWDYWLRFGWRRPVTEETAAAHLDQLRRRLHRDSWPVVLVTGLHRDPMRHAHGLLKLSRRQRLHILNATEAEAFLQLRWPHGEVWAQAFDGKDPRGSVAYVARHPETVSW